MVAAPCRKQGWLLVSEVGKDQGISSRMFRNWCFRGFPRGSPKLDTRRLRCPMADGRAFWRVMYASDNIKRLADWYNGLPSADETYRKTGPFTAVHNFCCALNSRRTGKRPARPLGQDGKAPGVRSDLPAIATLAQNGLRRTGRRGPWRPVRSRCAFPMAKFAMYGSTTWTRWRGWLRQGEATSRRRPSGRHRRQRTPKKRKPRSREQENSEQAAAVVSHHDDRDKCIYEQAMQGTEWDLIRIRLHKHPEWEPIGTINGIKDAARRYARRHGLPVPPRRKRGRPAGK